MQLKHTVNDLDLQEKHTTCLSAKSSSLLLLYLCLISTSDEFGELKLLLLLLPSLSNLYSYIVIAISQPSFNAPSVQHW